MAVLLVLKSASLVKIASAGAAPEASAASPPAATAQAASQQAGKTEAARIDAAQAEAAKNQAAKAEAPPRPETPQKSSQQAPVATDSERTLLTDLRARRLSLDTRAASLAAREATMAAVEQRLAGRVGELTALQHRLETLEAQRKEHDEQNWRGLVKLYESMKPRDAALIFNDLDLPVLLPVLDRMKEAKAAPILSAMTPDRARLVTTELAQSRTRANSIETLMPPRPGG